MQPGRELSQYTTPFDGLLGSSAEEGRAKPRYYSVQAQGAFDAEITEWDIPLTHISEEEPAELKHLSRQRKRNQLRLGQ